jgi:hypothetical protein
MEILGYLLSALAVAGLWVLFQPKQYRLSFLHLIMVYWSFQTIGVYTAGSIRGEYGALLLMLGGIFAWLLGLQVHRFLSLYVRNPKADPIFQSLHVRRDFYKLSLFSLLIFLIIVYHYWAGGIPLFARNVKQEAFELVRSGFYGIPGRIFRFGPLFLIFLINAYFQLVANAHPRLRQLRWMVYVLSGIAFVLNGHKSAVLVVIQAIIITAAYSPRWNPLEHISIRKIFVYGTVSILGVMALGYNLLSERGTTDMLGYLADRVFYVSGRPFDVMVHDFIRLYGYGYGSYTGLDFQHVMGLVNLVSAEDYPYNTSQMVSATIHGRSVISQYIVPTTTTVFGHFYVDGGWIGLLAGSFLFGMLCSWLYLRTRYITSPFARALFYCSQLAAFTISTKGNPIYSISSMVFALVFIVLVLMMSTFLVRLFAPREHLQQVPGFSWRPAIG